MHDELTLVINIANRVMNKQNSEIKLFWQGYAHYQQVINRFLPLLKGCVMCL